MIAIRFAAWCERDRLPVLAVCALVLMLLVDLAIVFGTGR